jgi:acyl dehydratase
MGAVQELNAPPPLGRLYLLAGIGSVRRATPGDATVPDVELVMRDLAVDRARLAEYDRVCGFRLRDELPPTYPHVLAFPLAMTVMTRPDFPFPLLGLVHVANRIDVLRPVFAGERLTVRVRAENLRPHERGRQLDLVSSAAVGDEEVWRGRSTYLRRERQSGDRAERADRAEHTEPPEPSAVWRVEPRVGDEYAAVSGDRNPIHTSRLLARALGFPRTIAHGMWSKARCLAGLEGRLPDAYAVEVSFKLPILLPSRVAFSADRSGADWRFALHDAKSGKPHLTGDVHAGT